MSKKVTAITIVTAAAIVATLGLFVPLASYTITHGCPDSDHPTFRLSLIKGDNLKDIETRDNTAQHPTQGCTRNATYTLYFL